MTYGSTLTIEVDPPESRKRRGAFFTPEAIADYLVEKTIDKSTKAVFEPSCGEAVFLRSAAHRLLDLGISPEAISQMLAGCELHCESAGTARAMMAKEGLRPAIICDDFFSVEKHGTQSAVIGNPPYIRYQDYSGERRNRALTRAREAGVQLSALASSWAPFVVWSMDMLCENGRLGMVLPAELLNVNYASPIRRELLNRFSHIEMTLFEKRVFPEAQEEVVLLVASGYGTGSSQRVRVRYAVDESQVASCPTREVPVDPHGGRWSSVLPDEEVPAFLPKSFCKLGTWGDVRLGAVTGSNAFFTMSKQRAGEVGLSEKDLVGLIPPGSKHLRRLAYGNDRVRELNAQGKQTLLFYPRTDRPSAAARNYIAYGEANEVSRAYKCRKRTPWWRVPIQQRPFDLLFTYMNADMPQLCANDAGAIALNSVHGVNLHDDVRELGRGLLPLAFLNTATALSAELNGRQYGGGILKLEPREAACVDVPGPNLVQSCSNDLLLVMPAVVALLEKGDVSCARNLVDDVVLSKGAGMSDEALRLARQSLASLQGRRRARSRGSKLQK